MTLRPLHGPARKRRFHVYDLEWVPGDEKKASAHGMTPMALRVIGHFDGKRYRPYYRVQDFLNAVCTPENTGVWFYAHAGGLADLVYILEYLVDNPKPYIRVSCQFSGSSAIIVRIDKGKNHWFFVDSYWLLRDSLRKIAAWVGMVKGGSADDTEHFYDPLPQLIEYNEQDCRILYTAIALFEKHLLELGGELQKTIASTAMKLFRRKFLSIEIKTNEQINEWAREAYFASRVEPFERECSEADYYDINSSFPYAMTFDCPANVIGSKKSLKDGDLGMARVRIKVPDSHIPPSPYRGKDNRVYFPTGEWESWFSNVDLELLQEKGGQILKSYEAVTFDRFTDLKDYAETIYGWRKETTDLGLKMILKYLLNSLYGKFGEGRQKQKVLINPPAEFFKIPEREPGGLGREMLMPGVHALVEDRDIPHAHVPIAMHITALARRNLTEYLIEAERPYYCDTDGFAVPRTVKLPQSTELGGLKLEKHIFKSLWPAPKLYAYQEAEGEEWKVRAKGFSGIGKRKPDEPLDIAYHRFLDVLEHKDYHFEHFSRLKENWRDGLTKPREVKSKKTWRGKARPKRRPVGNSSVPWEVRELL